MRLGVISDINSNLPALEAVAADMPDVDGLVCAGDVVGYNPWPAECLAWVRERDLPTVMGNHDRMVAGAGNFRGNHMAEAGVRYSRAALDDDQLDWLADLPAERRLHDGVHVVHGHPDDPDHYTRPLEFGPDLLRDASVLVMGHTHVQHHERYDEGVVMNPGSVGQPRDGDPRAAYAVLDLADLSVEERRVEYDIDAVVEAVEEAGLPRRIGSRLREGR
ncbi:MAG: metallophosphoesterase [Halobacteriaceae archaeon]